eukprot:2330004-Prymnesium_polylepis.2
MDALDTHAEGIIPCEMGLIARSRIRLGAHEIALVEVAVQGPRQWAQCPETAHAATSIVPDRGCTAPAAPCPGRRCVRAFWHVAKALVVGVVEGARDVLSSTCGFVLDVAMADREGRVARRIRHHNHAHVGNHHALRPISVRGEEVRFAIVRYQNSPIPSSAASFPPAHK